ncbi:MAG TPA: tetratricopeptide repeat protein [Spirochaetota bacterium]|nr:tetratricopeptide repeat protein [Spirochaetota bacterium]
MKKPVCIAAILLIPATIVLASYDDALKLFQENKYRESLEKIAAELSVDRDFQDNSPNYALRFLAAHNHWKMGNHEAAISHFRRCADIRKNLPDPLIDLGLLLIDFKRYRDAELFAQRALTLQKSPTAYYVVAKSAYGLGNYWRAKEFFEKAISLDPEFFAAYNGLGMTLMRLGRYTQASTAFAAALASAPASPELLNNMGLCLEKMGKPKEALEYYKKADRLNQGNAVIQQNLARLSARG